MATGVMLLRGKGAWGSKGDSDGRCGGCGGPGQEPCEVRQAFSLFRHFDNFTIEQHEDAQPEGPQTGNLWVDWKHEVRTGRAACRSVPIQFGWSFSSDSEKRSTHGIPKPTYTTKVQAGKSVIKITTSQSAAVATNAIGNSLADRPVVFWAMLFPRFVADAG
jgi:hypothetical protein